MFTKLFGTGKFPGEKDSAKVLIINIIYSHVFRGVVVVVVVGGGGRVVQLP